MTFQNVAPNAVKDFAKPSEPSDGKVKADEVVAQEKPKTEAFVGNPQNINKDAASSPLKIRAVAYSKAENRPQSRPAESRTAADESKISLTPAVEQYLRRDAQAKNVSRNEFIAPPAQSTSLEQPLWLQVLSAAGWTVVALWSVFVVYHLGKNGFFTTGQVFSNPVMGSLALAGVLAPAAMWAIVLGSLVRKSDARLYGEALKDELRQIIIPTDETAQYVHKNLTLLTQEAATFSATARTALQGIQKVRQALRTEAGEFSGLANKTEFQIERLTEVLQTRVKSLSDATTEIETRTGTVEKAMADGEGKVNTMLSRLKGKSDEITTSLDTTFGKFDGLVTASVGRLQGVGEHFDKQIEKLDGATAQIEGSAKTLLEKLTAQSTSYESMAKETMGKLETTSGTITEQSRQMQAGVQSLSSQLERTLSIIGETSQKIDRAGQTLSDQAQAVDVKLSDQIQKLQDTMTRMRSDSQMLEGTGEAVAAQMTDVLSSVLHGFEKMNSGLLRSLEQVKSAVTEKADTVEALYTQTTEGLQGLAQQQGVKQEKLQVMLQALAQQYDRAKELSLAVEQITTKLENSSDRQSVQVQRLGADVDVILQKLDEQVDKPFARIQESVRSVDDLYEGIESRLGTKIREIEDASQRSYNRAETIRQALKEQAQDIASVSGQVQEKANNILSAMQDHQAVSRQQAQDHIVRLERIHETLKGSVQLLDQVAEQSKDRMMDGKEAIIEQTNLFQSSREKIVTDINTIQETLVAAQKQLQLSAGDSRAQLEDVYTQVQEVLGDFTPSFEKAVTQAQSVREELADLNQTIDNKCDAQLERLSALGSDFDNKTKKMEETGNVLSTQLRGATTALEDRLTEIEKAAVDAEGRMGVVRRTLQEQAEDIHLVVDQAESKVDKFSSHLVKTTHDLSENVSQTANRFEAMMTGFDDLARHVDAKGQDIVARLVDTGKDVRDEVSALEYKTNNVVLKTQDLIGTLTGESTKLAEGSRAGLIELQKAGDSMALRAREFEEYMKSSLRSSAHYSSELKVHTQAVADAAQVAVEKVAAHMAALAAPVRDIKKVTDESANYLAKQREELQNEVKQLQQVIQKITHNMTDVTAAYVRQTDLLEKASGDAQDKVAQLRSAQGAAQQSYFMGSTKFIIESLHSLAIDVSRMLEGDVNEKALRAYQKGDATAFTRRLVNLEGQVPAEKIQKKYQEDSEFRAYVQKYCRQYEDIWQKADETDSASLLQSVFLSSDVGKLYFWLCQAVGRQPVSVKERPAA